MWLLVFFFINNRYRSVADDQYDQNFPPWGIRTDQPYLHFRGSTIVCNIWLAKNDCHLHVIACNKLNETDFYQTIAYLGRRNNVVEKTWIYQFIAKNLHLSYKNKACDELDTYIIHVYTLTRVHLV